MRKKLVAGNWKMNLSFREALDLTAKLRSEFHPSDKVDVAIAPSFPYLYPIVKMLEDNEINVLAQNMHWADFGAYTGEVSAPMLRSVGVNSVILGHSERRLYFHETPEILQKKVNRAILEDFHVIFCIGEKWEDRKAGKHIEVIQNQIAGSLFKLELQDWNLITLAYEPVWAIGTGQTASPEQAQEMHSFIRRLIKNKYGSETANQVRILYGGSVKPGNAAELFAQPDIDGGLIGGASLKANDFLAIIQAAKEAG